MERSRSSSGAEIIASEIRRLDARVHGRRAELKTKATELAGAATMSWAIREYADVLLALAYVRAAERLVDPESLASLPQQVREQLEAMAFRQLWRASVHLDPALRLPFPAAVGDAIDPARLRATATLHEIAADAAQRYFDEAVVGRVAEDRRVHRDELRAELMANAPDYLPLSLLPRGDEADWGAPDLVTLGAAAARYALASALVIRVHLQPDEAAARRQHRASREIARAHLGAVEGGPSLEAADAYFRGGSRAPHRR